ncbi:MAG: ATP-dependent DNA ligase [Candidatus Micrarchaeota archaeon]|nr:ATP-dependent DNA ligase [Candidatus Micrarchaeota archaeon]
MQFSKLVDSYEKLEAVSSRLKMIEILTEVLKESGKGEISKIVYMTQGTLLPAFEGAEFGVAEKLVEEAIAVATGFTKEQVDADFKKTGDLGLTAQRMRENSKLKSMRARSNTVSDVYDTMRKVAATSGQGSKEGKITLLANMFASATPAEAKYIARYPLGQLRLGVGDATILEALSAMSTGNRESKSMLEEAYNICSDLGEVAETLLEGGVEAIKSMRVSVFKPIRPALAERLPTAEQILERMNGMAAVEHKYDGFRLQVHKSGKKVRLFSRRLEDVTDMFPDIIAATLAEVKDEKIIFEGEAIAYNEATKEFLPFQETIQRKRKHGIAEKAEELPLHLFAFDLMYLGNKDWLKEPYKKRRAELEKILSKGKRIIPTTKIITKSPKELESFFEEAIEEGLEGIMTKDLEAPYIAGARKFSWIKLKRSYKGELSDTVDLVIIGYFLGKGSRAEFKFGGLLGAVYNEKRDMFETVSRIGSGFTEVQMTELEKLLGKTKTKTKPARVDAVVEPDFWVYPKYVVTVMADEITKSPTHTCGREKQKDGTEVGYALRFPRLVGDTAIRQDKSPEEATTTKEIIEMYGQQKKVGVKES